jgi:hypothetical protein
VKDGSSSLTELTAAGFTDIAIAPFEPSTPFGEGGTRDEAIDDAVKMAFEGGPLSRALADQPDDIRAPTILEINSVLSAYRNFADFLSSASAKSSSRSVAALFTGSCSSFSRLLMDLSHS